MNRRELSQPDNLYEKLMATITLNGEILNTNIMHNGDILNTFPQQLRIRQGCAFFLLLFSMALDVLDILTISMK